MAVKDAIVLNTTGSNFQAVQSGDTVRIKGDSTELLSIENSSETRVFSVGTSTTSVNIEGNVTSSKPISGSSTSTASFGHFVADTYEGDAREIAATLPRSGDIVSGSSQIADDVSGSFISGFTFGATADELYIGVSGSNSSHSASISGSTAGMAASGSDLTPLKSDEIGHIRGIVAAGTFSAGGALITGRGDLLGAGAQNAALAFGGYGPSNTRNKTEHFDGTSWTEGGDLVRSHHNGVMGAGWGVQNAALKAAGAGPGLTTSTEEYNGTTWTEVTDLSIGRCYGGGAGTQNAGVIFGGSPGGVTCTEEYNGSSWSVSGAMITGGNKINQGTGLQDAALAAGLGGSPTDGTCSEEYNGSTWSAGGIMPDKKSCGTTAGTQNAAIVMDGIGGSSDDVALHYDGSTWSTGGTSLHNRNRASSAGLQSATLKFGGSDFHTCTEHYDANYTTTGSFGRIEAGYVVGNAEDIKGQIPRDAGLVTSSAQLADDISGSFISGFGIGVTENDFYIGVSGSNSEHSSSVSGSTAGQSASGSDFDIFGSAQIRGHVGSGVWSAGGAMIAGRSRNNRGGTGVENAAIIAGSGPTEYAGDAVTEHYNGTSWTAAGSALSTARRYNSLTGTQNAALATGGLATWTNKNNSEIYNGATWAATTALPTISGSMISFGTQNAAAVVGMHMKNNGYIYNWNGTSWSTPSVAVSICQTPSATAISGVMAGGSQNSGIVAFGNCNGLLSKSFTFDGTSFTATADINTARNMVGGWGTANSAIAAGGVNPGHKTCTELWDGTTWSETADLINAGKTGGSAGAQAEHGITTTGGEAPAGIGLTEEYDGNFLNTGSFGYVKAGFLKGDAGNIGASLASGSNVVSGSFQLAVDISGSFDEGFNFGATFESRLMGPSGSGAGTPGASGSSTFYSSSATGHPSLQGVQLNSSGSDVSGSIYNAYGGEIKSGISGVWTAGTSMPYNVSHASGTGTKDAFLIYGDTSAPNASALQFDGSSWSAAGTIGSGSSRGTLFGTQDAAVATGRYPNSVSTKTEHWDGSSWSDGADSPFQQTGAGTGTQNAGFHHGGTPSPRAATRHYDGTAWSTEQDSNEPRFAHGAAGDQYAAMIVGGWPSFGDSETKSELYDGTSWTVISDTNTSERYRGIGAGTVNDYLIASGPSTVSEHYDGSAWSIQASLSNNHYSAGGDGATGLSVIIAGGAAGANTELYNGALHGTGSFGRIESGYFTGDATSISSTIFSVTNTGAVSSSAQIASDVSGSFISGMNVGGTMRDLFTGVSGSATSSYGQVMGATSSSLTGSDFTHQLQQEIGHIRGTMSGATNTFSAGGTLGTARYLVAAAGVVNAALAFGGKAGTPSADSVTCTEEYDGSSWSTATPLDNAGNAHSFGTGTQNAALVSGRGWGSVGQKTEAYDGHVWSELSNSGVYGFNRSLTGTRNAAIKIGGRETLSITEHFNGTVWSVGGELNVGRQLSTAVGLENAAMAIGGPGAPALGANNTCTEHYDGSTWTVAAARITANSRMSGFGTQNEASIVGGTTDWDNTEHFDGTAWSAGVATPTVRGSAGSSGNTNNGLSFGGYGPSPYPHLSSTEHYEVVYTTTGSFGQVFAQNFTGDGSGLASTLPRSANIVSGSPQIADDVSGSFVSGFNFGDSVNRRFDGVSGSRFTPGVSGSSQFYSSSFGHISEMGGISGSHPSGGADYTYLLESEIGHLRGTVGSGTWSAGGSLITARQDLGGAGAQKAAIAYGGSTPTIIANTEHYDGSTWSAGGAMIIAKESHGSAGIENAALSIGGSTPSTLSNTEHYNGANWTAGGSKITASTAGKAAGTENAGLQFGGVPSNACTEEYNGTAWSVGGALPQAICVQAGGFGLQNAALSAGGATAASSPNNATTTLHYNGDTWSEGGAMIIARSRGAGGGTENAGIVGGGLTPSRVANTEHYDGTAWSAGGSMIIARALMGTGGVGLQHSALGFGGSSPTIVANTEEYDANFLNTGSFGRVEATYIEGDATEISSSLATTYSVKTSSSDLEADISGSFMSGIDLKGPITSQPIGAWRQVQNSNIPRGMHALIGDKDCAIALGDGGYSPAPAAVGGISTEIYDGQSWKSGVNLPLSFRCGEAAGDVGSELLFGGEFSGSHSPYIAGIKNGTLRGDGTSFSQDAYMNTAQTDGPAVKGGNVGIQNSALSVQLSYPSPGLVTTEEYDGMTWKLHPKQPNVHAGNQSTGTVTAAIVFGGYNKATCTEFFDGSSWATGPALSRGKCGGAAAGTQNDVLTIGGASFAPGVANQSYNPISEMFDGTTWTSTTSQGGGLHVRGDGNGGGSANAIAHGGHSSSARTCVWDINYRLSGSFGRVEPKHGIITDRFELKGKNIDDNNTVLLIHSDHDNDSIIFSGSLNGGDSSLSNHSMSFSGSVKHTSSFAQFGSSSIYFGGDGVLEVSGSGTANRDLEFGSDEFTIEYWVRQDAAQVAKTVLRKPGSYVLENETDVNNIIFKFNESASISVSSNYTSSVDLWNHVAVVRHADTLNMYVNGKLRDTRADMTESMGSYGNSLFLGDADLREGTDTAFSGYIDEFRISNIARYNIEFIPEEGTIQRINSGSSPDAPFSTKKIEPVTFKLPKFTNRDQPSVITQTLFQSDYSSSLSSISGSRTGRSGSGLYIKEENVGTVAGDMWFNRENNSLNFTFESSSYSGGVWSVGGAMMIAKEWPEGAGVANAAVVFGGHNHPTNCTTEHYDGAAWTRGGDQISSKSYFASAGIQNAALAFGGNPSNTAEHYNGAVWSAGGTPGCDRYSNAGTGRENAALNFGGEGVTADTEEYNGSSWSEGGNLNTARRLLSGAGEQYATLAIGGGTPTVVACTEEYNGSVWAVATALPATRLQNSAGGGVGDAWMAGGGNPSLTGATLEWNGSTWNTGGTLNTNKNGGAGDGSAGNAFVAGGTAPAAIANTEEYDGSGVYKNLVVCALTGSQA